MFLQPALNGYGNIKDLYYAMTEDASLLQNSKVLTNLVSLGKVGQFKLNFENFMHKWAGTGSDKIKFVEKLYGQTFNEANGGIGIGDNAQVAIKAYHDKLIMDFAVKFG